MTNKKLSIILSGVIGLLVIIFILIMTSISNNESSKIFFKKKDLNNTTWVKSSNSMKINNNRMTLIINDETVIDNKEFDVDSRSGKFSFKDSNEEIYLKSMNTDYVVIWYKMADYHLDKEIIIK